jgi:hypothetical protein
VGIQASNTLQMLDLLVGHTHAHFKGDLNTQQQQKSGDAMFRATTAYRTQRGGTIVEISENGQELLGTVISIITLFVDIHPRWTNN